MRIGGGPPLEVVEPVVSLVAITKYLLVLLYIGRQSPMCA
jgi:hypothetical protein